MFSYRIEKTGTQTANHVQLFSNLHGTIFVNKFLKVKEKLKGKNISITENLKWVF